MKRINIGDNVAVNDKIMYGYGLPCKVVDEKGDGALLEYLVEIDGNLRIWFQRHEIEAAQPADQQRQPADADLTPDEVDALRRLATADKYVALSFNAPQIGWYETLVKRGFAEETRYFKGPERIFTITEHGRAHLAALTSAPADVPTAAADTITVSIDDAYKMHTALVAQVIRLTEHIDDPDYEGNTDNLVRIIRETEAVLDRLTKQLQ